MACETIIGVVGNIACWGLMNGAASFKPKTREEDGEQVPDYNMCSCMFWNCVDAMNMHWLNTVAPHGVSYVLHKAVRENKCFCYTNYMLREGDDPSEKCCIQVQKVHSLGCSALGIGIAAAGFSASSGALAGAGSAYAIYQFSGCAYNQWLGSSYNEANPLREPLQPAPTEE